MKSIRSNLFPEAEQYLLHWVRPFLLAILLASLIWLMRPMGSLDNAWSDVLLSNQKHSVSDNYLAVSVTQQDLINLGKPNLDRQTLAKGIVKLHESGAKRVLLDYLFSGRNLPKIDQDLTVALNLFNKTDIAFGRDADPVLAAPTYFTSHANLVSLAFQADKDGIFRRIKYGNKANIPNAAVWLAKGSLEVRNTPIDIRLNPASVKTMSFTELLADQNPNLIRGKAVVVSFDRKLSMSRLRFPIIGELDRAKFVALAAQSYANNYASNYFQADAINRVLAIFVFFISFLIGALSQSVKSAFSFIIGLVLLVMGLDATILWVTGAATIPATTALLMFSSFYLALAHRLRLTDLFSSFMSGNLSPEEVWQWRSQSDRDQPVILFDANCGIKRLNKFAIEQFGIEATPEALKYSPFAKLCLPSFGERLARINLGNRDVQIWKIDWPHLSIPLAIFTNVTDQIQKEETLEQKLVTDSLTGLLNKAGFNAILADFDAQRIVDYAVFYMDMNGFKQVNDTYGHDAGDELLKVVAKRFTSVLRDGDKIARLGGDEFAVITKGQIEPTIAQAIADKLEKSLHDSIKLTKATVNVRVAVGYSYPKGGCESSSQVVAHADANMYLRKSQIKNNLPIKLVVNA